MNARTNSLAIFESSSARQTRHVLMFRPGSLSGRTVTPLRARSKAPELAQNRSKPFDGIVIDDTSRFGRNLSDTLQCLTYSSTLRTGNWTPEASTSQRFSSRMARSMSGTAGCWGRRFTAGKEKECSTVTRRAGELIDIQSSHRTSVQKGTVWSTVCGSCAIGAKSRGSAYDLAHLQAVRCRLGFAGDREAAE
jgi:hypothetical protein